MGGMGQEVLNLALRAVLAARRPGFLTEHPRPVTEVRHLVPGADPVRVLVLGSGLAAGHGVTETRHTLTGRLAPALADRLRHGVVIESRAEPFLPLVSTVPRLGPNGAHTFRAAVYFPGFTEVTYGGTVRWRRHLHDLVASLHATGGPALAVLLAGLPSPDLSGTLERVGRVQVARTNAALEEAAASFPRTVFVDTPSYPTLRSPRPFDADYYHRCAARLAAALEGVLAPVRAC